MSAASNPYRPPSGLSPPPEDGPTVVEGEIDWARFPDHRVPFQYRLEVTDIRRLFQTTPVGCLVLLAALLAVLLLLVTQIASPSRGMMTVSWAPVLFPFSVLAGTLALAAWLKSFWRQALAQTPSLTEPTSGFLCEAGIYVERQTSRHLYRWPGLQQIVLGAHGAQVQAEEWRMVSLLIPWHAFPDEPAARAILGRLAVGTGRRPLKIGDPEVKQLPEEPPRFPPAGPHVTYQGPITYGHFTRTRPGRRLWRTIRRWAVGGVGTLLLGLLTLLLAASPLDWFVGLPLVILGGFFTYRVARVAARWSASEDVAFAVRGWIGPERWAQQSALGETVRHWSDLADQSLEADTLCLRLPTSVEAWQFFPRELFADDGDFEQARQWMRDACVDRRAETADADQPA